MLIGPVLRFQPRRSQAGAHFVIVFTQSWLSVWTSTAASPGSILNASMSARSSIRLLVVSRSWPCAFDTISPRSTQTTPQPPGPGLGTALPSVNTPVTGSPGYLASTSSSVKRSSRDPVNRGSPVCFREARRPAPSASRFFGECRRQ